jgi:dienelactone hydrolase
MPRIHRSTSLALVLAAACSGSHGNPGTFDSPPATHDAPRGTDAPVSTGTDPASDGSYAVVQTDITLHVNNRTAGATTFVPTGAPAPRPLVWISPGFQMQRAQYASYAHHLASWGFTVVLADYTDKGFFPSHQQLADDVHAGITWALAESSLAIDPAKIATAGHSLGGKISMLVAAGDPRVTAVVGWDPVDGGSAPTVVPGEMALIHGAVAVIGETTDGAGQGMPCAPIANNYQTFYGAAASPALAMTIDGAQHMDWVDDMSCSLCGFCAAGTASASRARDATKRLNVAWLRAHLLGDSAMSTWLSSPPEVAAGHASVSQK